MFERNFEFAPLPYLDCERSQDEGSNAGNPLALHADGGLNTDI